MLIIITNIVKYTLLYTVDTVKYSMNTEDILEELTKVDVILELFKLLKCNSANANLKLLNQIHPLNLINH